MLKLRVRIEAEKPTDLLAVQSAKIWRVSALLAAYHIDEQAALDRSIVKMQTQRLGNIQPNDAPEGAEKLQHYTGTEEPRLLARDCPRPVCRRIYPARYNRRMPFSARSQTERLRYQFNSIYATSDRLLSNS